MIAETWLLPYPDDKVPWCAVVLTPKIARWLPPAGSSDGVVCLWRPLEAALTSRHNLGHAGTHELARLEVRRVQVVPPRCLSSSSSFPGGGLG